jgi:Amt family ammonium transporter
VLVTVVLSGLVAAVIFGGLKALGLLRVPEEHEREGLDITSHGESAYEA